MWRPRLPASHRHAAQLKDSIPPSASLRLGSSSGDAAAGGAPWGDAILGPVGPPWGDGPHASPVGPLSSLLGGGGGRSIGGTGGAWLWKGGGPRGDGGWVGDAGDLEGAEGTGGEPVTAERRVLSGGAAVQHWWQSINACGRRATRQPRGSHLVEKPGQGESVVAGGAAASREATHRRLAGSRPCAWRSGPRCGRRAGRAGGNGQGGAAAAAAAGHSHRPLQARTGHLRSVSLWGARKLAYVSSEAALCARWMAMTSPSPCRPLSTPSTCTSRYCSSAQVPAERRE